MSRSTGMGEATVLKDKHHKNKINKKVMGHRAGPNLTSVEFDKKHWHKMDRKW